jgi:two-component system response regulator DevR
LQRPASGGAVALAEPADGGVLPVALGEVSGHYAEVDQEEAGVVRAAVRVFLLDDHEVVRRGLRELLEDSGGIEVVGEAARADEALRRIPAVRPDVAVLDARLPDGSGIEVCREIRSSLPSVACLILTSYDDDEALFAAIMAGAAGYVLKQIRGTDLVDAVHRVARGQSMLDPAVTANVFTRLREGPPATDPRLEALSDREQEVLTLIADGLSNREIGARLYLAEKTVKNHVSRLLAKLQMQRRTQVAVFGAAMRDQSELRPQRPES